MKWKRQKFVLEYCKDFNGTKAAERAGYSVKTANEQAAQLLANISIKEAIAAHMAAVAMDADEALSRLAHQARATYTEYITDEGTVDLPALLADGYGHLIKSIKPTEHGQQIEFVDSQKALLKIGEVHQLFKQAHTGTIDVGIRVYRGPRKAQTTEEWAAQVQGNGHGS